MKQLMNSCKDKLKERNELITMLGFQSKDRILLDEEVKGMMAQCETMLRSLR